MISIWRNRKQIRNNPIYKRENGHWGEPNAYYQTISRYMPFVVLLVMVLGFCFGTNTLSATFGLSMTQSGFAIASCLPNFVVQMISWAALILVPALTAPMVVEERRLGTWEILRLTPFTTEEILVSKLLGGLMRLKLWKPLLVLNGLQLLAGLFGVLVAISEFNWDSSLLLALFNPIVIVRPWIEIGWVALVGLVLSTWTDSSRAALVGTYAIALGFKFVNGWLLWIITYAILESLWLETGMAAVIVTVGPFIGYVGCLMVTWWLLKRRARKLDEALLLEPL